MLSIGPQHPYTAGTDGLEFLRWSATARALSQIDGSIAAAECDPGGPAPSTPRCTRAFDRCRVERPDLIPVMTAEAACWLHATDSR